MKKKMAREGLVLDMPNEEYHSGHETSCSAIKNAVESMADYHEYMLGEKVFDPKLALDGNVIHCAILEPKHFMDRYVVAPKCDRRTKAGKAAWADFAEANIGKELITEQQYDMANRAQDNVYADKWLNELLAPDEGDPEASCFFTDEITGIQCKVRPDWLRRDGIVLDVKSCRSLNDTTIYYDCKKFLYNVQDAFYSYGIKQTTGMHVTDFIFLFVCKQPPYLFKVFKIGQNAKESGMFLFRDALAEIADAKAYDVWPGHGSIPREIDW